MVDKKFFFNVGVINFATYVEQTFAMRQSCIMLHSAMRHSVDAPLHFQQAPADVCMSNRSRVTAGFMKTVACTTTKKGKKNKQKYKFINLHHPHFLRPHIWHFLSRNTIPLQLNRLPFFRPIFLNDRFKFLLPNTSKDCLSFLDHLASISKFYLHSLRFNGGNNQKWHGARSGLYGAYFITSVLWRSSHSCIRGDVCGQALSWKNHRRRRSGCFHKPLSRSLFSGICNTSYLSTFLKGTHVDRPSLGNRRWRPTSLCPLTFPEKHILSRIRHHGATFLTQATF